MTDDTFETETPADEAIAETPDQAAEASAEATEATDTEGEAPADGATTEPVAEQDGAAQAEVRPREVIKGIHPELRCEDPDCGPEFTELQFFSPEEAVKVKGKTMLFCARSGKKYFAPAPELQAWLADNKVKPTGRGRRES
jgi:hypothetical protein